MRKKLTTINKLLSLNKRFVPFVQMSKGVEDQDLSWGYLVTVKREGGDIKDLESLERTMRDFRTQLDQALQILSYSIVKFKKIAQETPSETPEEDLNKDETDTTDPEKERQE